MIQNAAHANTGVPVEEILRDGLSDCDALVGTIAPILRQLLVNDDHSVFSDEIIARVRGMMRDVAVQLLDEIAAVSDGANQRDHPAETINALVRGFVAHAEFLNHTHALALEWQLTERLQDRLALDPVLSPLLESLIGAVEPETASLAMSLLAAQARFSQSQRRMQLPLSELPGDLLHAALLAMRHCAVEDEVAQSNAASAEAVIRSRFDEGLSRLGLISRLVTGMGGGGGAAALSVPNAGIGIFLTALSLASGQDRDMAVLATNDGQKVRLALALRAAGLSAASVQEQYASIHSDAALPHGFEHLGADQAAALLSRSSAFPGN
jgi:hypothetical protein